MRGKVKVTHINISLFRITPAYAGKSNPSLGIIKKWEDHPRLCGEKVSVSPHVSEIEGSPPPMRGKVHQIPRHKSGYLDHPRLCGEKLSS